jgi:hypothetical protein
MKTAEVRSAPGPGPGTGALIREARRRKRRRYAATGLAVVAVLAGALGALAGLHGASQSRRPSQRRPESAAGHSPRPQAPGPIPRSLDTTVLMWPAGYPLFTPSGGPPAYLDNLTDGQLVRHQIPGIAGGDFEPYVISVGRWIVYVGNGTVAIRDDLKGKPRVLGKTPFFAKSATPGQVWLEYYRGGVLGQGPVSVRSVPVAAGRPGPKIMLPAGASLVEGTDAGLLLEVRQGRNYGLALWNPGAAPHALPHSPSWGNALAADARLVAYGTGCKLDVTALHAKNDPNTGYDLCKVLRILNVVTGRLVSLKAPVGTAGWVPDGFYRGGPIAPGNETIAAEAKLHPTGQGSERLYVIGLSGPRPRLTPVPSAALVDASAVWSAQGSWLLYQGPGQRMWAYQATTGRVRSSSTPCCQYAVMATINRPSG